MFKVIAEYSKEISALELQIDALKEISREYELKAMEQIILKTEKRLEETEKARDVAISDIRTKLEKFPLLKEIFQLRYVEGLEFKEIASKLNYSERNIYKLHKKLKELLKK